MRRSAWTRRLMIGISLAIAPAAWAADPPVNTNAVLIYYDSSGNMTLDPAEPQNGSSYSHETLLEIGRAHV